MNERTTRLREESLDAVPVITAERAVLLTEIYRDSIGKWSVPVLRARAFLHIVRNKEIRIGDSELIVGERGPRPKVVPTFPELTCHSVEDLEILDSRPKTAYRVPPEVLAAYQTTVIPFWRGLSLRDRIMAMLPEEWHAAYSGGMFTEFMEQRAPGHTVLDGKIYTKGMRGFQADIDRAAASLDWEHDPAALDRREELEGMRIACDALILWAERYAQKAEELARRSPDQERQTELARIAEVCRRVPAEAPRDLHEALQHYWFCHLGVITELNGWDSFCPGHLDQHLLPFYRQELEAGTLTPEAARELVECFFVKLNNHPAPPKVGVTAAESGTYTDFANINLGGLTASGEDGSNEVSHLLLDVIDEMHLLQPSSNVQLSRQTDDAFLTHALQVIRHGWGFPSVFNADAVVAELLRQGKTIEDARAGGCSGCVETGAFGKEAYILTGYLNLPKVLDLALHDGVDPRTGVRLGPATGPAETLASFGDLAAAFRRQLDSVVDVKIRGSLMIERLYATAMPAPFLSVLIDDCIASGRDYNAGGARYNTSYIQGVGIGTITDSLAAIGTLVYRDRSIGLPEIVAALDADFAGQEMLRQRMVNRMPKWGNDDDRADDLMRLVFEAFLAAVDGRPNARGGEYHIQMLPTTCHVYFGSVLGATPDGRRAGTPVSEGISPVQGADRKGPTAVFASAAKMDHLRTGGTLLNMKLAPQLVAGEEGLTRWAALVRSYFRANGHHVQFNVVDAATLEAARRDPEAWRGLIVRVAGYSDYFCDLSGSLQQEIMSRTEQGGF